MKNLIKKTKELKKKALTEKELEAEKLLLSSKASNTFGHQLSTQQREDQRQAAVIWAREVGKHGFR